MAWIQSHQEIKEHPKTTRLKRRLGVSLPTTIGHLHMFWWWGLTYAETGDLSGVDDEIIADACGWEGEPSEFIEALISAGFVDKNRHIHDWSEYTGRLISRREQSRIRQARYRESRETNALVTRDSNARSVTKRDSNANVRVSHGSREEGEKRRQDKSTPHIAPPVPTLPWETDDSAPGGAATKTAGTEDQSLTAGSADNDSKPAKRRGPTAAPEMTPTPEMYAWAAQECGFDERRTNLEMLKMLDHFRSNGKRKTDWLATWRNWMRNAVKYDGQRSSTARPAVRPPTRHQIGAHPPEVQQAQREHARRLQAKREAEDAPFHARIAELEAQGMEWKAATYQAIEERKAGKLTAS